MPNPFTDPYSTPVRRHIVWRLPLWAFERFKALLDQLELVEDDSDEANALKDELRSLPGFPLDNDPDSDLIHFDVTDRRYS